MAWSNDSPRLHLARQPAPDTALARVVAVFGAAKPHSADLFANRRANRIKVLVHDDLGIWLAARRLNQGKFHWTGIPIAGLLAHVMVTKFADHLPLYRQEKIFRRAGLTIPRSTLAQ